MTKFVLTVVGAAVLLAHMRTVSRMSGLASSTNLASTDFSMLRTQLVAHAAGGLLLLVATARKERGTWRWDEYTRNFPDEGPRRILVGQGVCTGCHQQVREADWIFTHFSRP